MLRHCFAKIIIEIVTPINPTNGVAVFIPMAKDNNGMAISASPKPNVERVNVEIKIIGHITL